MSKRLKKHFTCAKPVSVRLCMYVSVCAGWAAVPRQTPARSNYIKQNLAQESDIHHARQQTFRLDITNTFITPLAKPAAGLYDYPAYSVYHRHILTPFVST